jgi:hypothetical protein
VTDRFEQALVHAARLHRGQRRKGAGVPYISHLLAVASLVLQHGGDEEEAIAALLHDAIEDIGGEDVRRGIRECFGERVLEIVEGCTDSEETPKPPWRERKQAFIDRLPRTNSTMRGRFSRTTARPAKRSGSVFAAAGEARYGTIAPSPMLCARRNRRRWSRNSTAW